MKSIVIIVAMLMLISVNAYAEHKLINITEDTIPEDSFRPVAGKEFLVAVKLVDVDGELNTENPVSNEPIVFQTSMGTLSETEVTTNIYGEAITWLATDTTPDITHSISASVKDKPEITPITIAVKNIALPQDAPTAEELISTADTNVDKIVDIKADIQVTSNAPWEGPTRQLKIWEKGEKQKVQEISPDPEIFIRPTLPPPANPPVVIKDILAYNPVLNSYVIQSKDQTQASHYPAFYDYIDAQKSVIYKKKRYIEQDGVISVFITDDSNFITINACLVFSAEKQITYQGIGKLVYTTNYDYTNIQINTGIPDSEFSQ